MSLDGITIKCLVNELDFALKGARVEKIYQPTRDTIILNLRTSSENVKLLLSAHSNYPRIYLTSQSYENPTSPPSYCMLLRKHLTSSRILSVTQNQLERVVQIDFEAYNELGDLTQKSLFIEIMGKHSNLILTDEHLKILDSIKHIDVTISEKRQVLPGLKYSIPPPQDKINILEGYASVVIGENIRADKYLLNTYQGLSPLLSSEILYRAKSDLEKIGVEAEKLFDNVRKNEFDPCIVYMKDTNQAFKFSSFKLTQYEDEFLIVSYPTINQVLDDFHQAVFNSKILDEKKSGILKVVNNNIDRVSKKIGIHQTTLITCLKKDEIKKTGDLIIANIYKLTKGQTFFEAEDFYNNNEPIKVKLDEKLSPSKNAAKYFNEYRKAQISEVYATEQLQKSNEELRYLEGVLTFLTLANDMKDIEDLKSELVETGYVKNTKKLKKGKVKQEKITFNKFTSTDGFVIFVGKNNKQNDELTLKLSSKNDLWFHTKNVPGSHTVVKTEGVIVPEKTLEEAAALAAFFSKARNDTKVMVDYTAIKNVKKPPGAKLGMVIYENYKTITIKPADSIKNT